MTEHSFTSLNTPITLSMRPHHALPNRRMCVIGFQSVVMSGRTWRGRIKNGIDLALMWKIRRIVGVIPDR